MTKKELNYAKRALKSEDETVECIASCYVTSDKNIFLQSPVSYSILPDDEGEQYLGLFRKTLNGTFERNLHEVEFSLDAEGEGTGHEILYEVLRSGLQDTEKNEMLFKRIVDSYDFNDPYCILALYATTDLPSGSREDAIGTIGTIEAIDDYDNVYQYILISICPIVPGKPALSYSPAEHRIESIAYSQQVSSPSFGLLFPALTDGNPDIHAMVCYTKKQEECDEKLVSDAFQCDLAMSATEVQDNFAQLLQESLGEACTFENIACIENKLQAMTETENEEEADLTINVKQFAAIVRENAEGKTNENIEEIYQNKFGDQEVRIKQAIPKKTVLKDVEFSISCSAEAAERVKIMQVNGESCVVLPLSGQAEVNGITFESCVSQADR